MNVGEKAARLIQQLDNIVTHDNETTSSRIAVIDVLIQHAQAARVAIKQREETRVAEMVAAAGLPVIGASVESALESAPIVL